MVLLLIIMILKNIKAHIQDINNKKEDGPQTICMGNTETVKYFICAVKGGRHCDQDEGNQRLEVRVSENCQTDGKSLISLTEVILHTPRDLRQPVTELHLLANLCSYNASLQCHTLSTYHTVQGGCQCGEANDGEANDIIPHIIWGKNATENEYPWIVSLIWKYSDKHLNKSYAGFFGRCTGSLLDSRHVLTAAHCGVDEAEMKRLEVGGNGMDIFQRFRVRLGVNLVKNNPKRTVASVKAYEIHKTYDVYDEFKKNSFDIAVLTLKQDIEYNDKIKPICLPSDPYPTKTYQNEEAVAAGWGKTEKGPKSDFLLKTNVRVLSHEECLGQRQRG